MTVTVYLIRFIGNLSRRKSGDGSQMKEGKQEEMGVVWINKEGEGGKMHSWRVVEVKKEKK